ncbi:MAG: DUF5916 domain-containing protein [Bacteroidota bacterium]
MGINKFSRLKKVTLLTWGIMLSLPLIVNAQRSASGTSANTGATSRGKEVPTVHATFYDHAEKIVIDGQLNEPIWNQAEVATGFIQRAPNDGQPATEATEARIIYTKEALYIAAKAYDSAIDSVAATLFRKDGSAYSDWFYVGLDSYNDDKTSFTFGVNPLGVRKDLLISNDTNEDERWDAIWTAKTKIQEDGWTVEIKIPLSQLRFTNQNHKQTWGVNFQREIARKDEISFWSPTPQQESGMVSKFGELRGIKNLEQPRRLEITPYVSGSVTRAPHQQENPYYNQNELFGSVGADIKYGVTSDLTLSATINPDFGQVEADPDQINLSAYETYFSEQRAFFVEGNEIFDFGSTSSFSMFGNPLTFYSRRIGRSPSGSVAQAGIEAPFVDRPDFTTIASAVKLSGKTQQGLSVGVLNALTTREKSNYQITDGTQGSLSIEPPTNYFVSRLKQDFNQGNTVIGMYAGAVNRFMRADYLKSQLHEASYIGGLDFEHYWNDREWILSGTTSISSVSGSKEALLRTQLSSARYFNRPDADYLSVDPNRTAMQGLAGQLSFARFGGKHWRGSVSYSVVTPGYEVNDIGYQKRVDYHGMAYFWEYRQTDPVGPFRNYRIGLNKFHAWNFGGEQTENGYDLITSAQLTNLWRVNFRTGFRLETYDDRMLRGGPLALEPGSAYGSLVLESDRSKKVAFSLGHSRDNSETGGFTNDYFINLILRPTSFIQVELKPNYNTQKSTRQYVTAVTDPTADHTFGKRYVFADIQRTTWSTALRMDWTFTPDISLQTYIRPYISSGAYSDYKEFTTPGKSRFSRYGQDRGTLSYENGIYIVDPDNEGPANEFTFQDRDFNYRTIQSNLVFRWEYKPGSILYLVWQHDRNSFEQTGNFSVVHDTSELIAAQPTNVLMVKLSYWFGS